MYSATRSDDGPIGAPYPADANAYDPIAANAFYGKRPLLLLSRLARLSYLTTAFNLRLLIDWQQYKRAGSPEGESWPNEEQRAKEALGLATQLGPTFIKLAQALSIRTDLIPEAYALELRQLQDAVPAFDSTEAKETRAPLAADDDAAFVAFDWPPADGSRAAPLEPTVGQHDRGSSASADESARSLPSESRIGLPDS